MRHVHLIAFGINVFGTWSAVAKDNCAKPSYETRCLDVQVSKILKGATWEQNNKYPDLSCHLEMLFTSKPKLKSESPRDVLANVFLDKGVKCPQVGTKMFGNVWITCKEKGSKEWPNRFRVRTPKNCLAPE